MTTTEKFPATRQARLELGPDMVRFPASFEEYWELLEVCDYPIEYHDHQIIATSYENDSHARIASMMFALLSNVFMENDDYVVFNPNRPVYIPATSDVFNPDVSVILEPAQKFVYRPGMDAEMTAVMVVEVLSKTTREHDLNNKLFAYKKIETIRQIIYIESQIPYVTVYTKIQQTGKWENVVYDEPDASFEVFGTTFSLRQLYKKTNLAKG